VREFFSGTTLQQGVEILRRNNVDYVMVAKDSQLTGSLERLSGFTPVETSSERYDLYAVDLQEVASKSEQPMSSPGALSVEWPSLDTRPGRQIS
jgi:biotin synthase-related radical SAM superfamily protein